MRHLQPFFIFESHQGVTPKQKKLLDACVIGSWTVNSRGEIDIQGDYAGGLYAGGQWSSPFEGIQFGAVTGNFSCVDSELKSLKGCPRKVGENFSCYNNYITSLEGGPEEVGGDYDCVPNDSLVSLVGAPKIVGSFDGPGRIRLYQEDWNPKGILQAWINKGKVYNNKGKDLLFTILPSVLQDYIDSNPSAALSDLKNYFSEPWFRAMDLKWPGKVGPWVNLMGDAGELGF
jgi:hypothetical protein